MKKHMVFLLALGMLLAVSNISLAVTIDVYASSAPNAYGSPSWAGYQARAVYAIENGLAAYGDRASDPTAYERAGNTIDPGDIAVTTFKSWRGVVNPLAPFQSELGNRLHFGLHILGQGTQFSISQLSFVGSSSDSTNSLGWSWAVGTYNYGVGWVGVNYGLDGVKGTADDQRINSGSNTQLVDELVGRGSGNAWWPAGDDPNPGNPAGGAQAAMDDYYAWIASEGPITVTGIYTLTFPTYDLKGSDAVQVGRVPEPATLMLLGFGLIGLAAARRKA